LARDLQYTPRVKGSFCPGTFQQQTFHPSFFVTGSDGHWKLRRGQQLQPALPNGALHIPRLALRIKISPSLHLGFGVILILTTFSGISALEWHNFRPTISAQFRTCILSCVGHAPLSLEYSQRAK
jgi:hypothetical protein